MGEGYYYENILISRAAPREGGSYRRACPRRHRHLSRCARHSQEIFIHLARRRAAAFRFFIDATGKRRCFY